MSAIGSQSEEAADDILVVRAEVKMSGLFVEFQDVPPGRRHAMEQRFLSGIARWVGLREGGGVTFHLQELPLADFLTGGAITMLAGVLRHLALAFRGPWSRR
ncbi:MAG: hypothetical protein ABJF23_23585 [Bryobacteraceae bacterium]